MTVPSVVWVTNLSAPYRRPVWALLSHRTRLSVGLLARSEPNRRWSTDLPVDVGALSVRSVRLHVKRAPLYLLLWPVLRSAARSPDVVILPGWENPAAWQLLLEAALKRVATIAFYESTTISQHFTKGPVALLRRWYFRHVDAVITVGTASREAVIDMGVAPEKIVTTNNSIDYKTLSSRLESGPPRGAPASAVRSRRFVYVGQLIERKNVAALLRALALCPSDFVLDILGEGHLLPQLTELATSLGLAERVQFVGYVEPTELGAHFCVASTLVLPSLEEVFGLAPAEALSVGLHAVVTSKAGIAPDIQAMRGVWVVDPEPAKLAAAMAESAYAWDQPIAEPQIRAWTPERVARDVNAAIDLALLGSAPPA